MTKPNSTEIIFVVDRSGSMQTIAADMMGGFDAFIEKQKETPGECKVTLTQFDDQHDVVYTARPLNEVTALELRPRGSTALLDAIGRTIITTGDRLRAMPEHERPSQVLFVIITDGHENASREFSRERVFKMISTQREEFSWEFVFLGANQDSIATAQSMGIHGSNAVTYDASGTGSRALFRGLSANVSSYRSSGQGRMENLYNQAKYDASLVGGPGDQDVKSGTFTTQAGHVPLIVPTDPDDKPTP